MLEDSKIRVFNTVIREGSFTKAARSLGISQPAVSQNISELEKLLGCQLFERSRSAATLTPDGIRFKEYAGHEPFSETEADSAAEEAFSPALPKALQQGIVRLPRVNISVPQGVECRLLPQDAEDYDIKIRHESDGLNLALVLKEK